MRKPYSVTQAQNYILSHGFGPATVQGLELAEELYESGLDYSEISLEVVTNDLTDDSHI